MISNRGSCIIEGLGEPEQDANSALTELDKGLRSVNVGEQCEAIVRFPRLFEKYPFPILINSSFLKLADVFRVGNNFLRLWVLRVCQQSEKHLDKILNVDEFVRRVFCVIHSNDPVARALSLRTLGSVACIIPERQQVHHCIRRSLDSHDTVEVEAAIQAAMQFAAQSKSFAMGMCTKISDMIQGLSTPAHMKLQLIPILQYMHHDTATAAMVRQVCTELVHKYPAKEFVVTTLNTLTKLASATLVDIPSQVELLVKCLNEDNRISVKVEALIGLKELAVAGPHLWPAECVTSVITFAQVSPLKSIVSLALDLFIVLTKSPVVCHEHISSGSPLVQLCDGTRFSKDVALSAKSVNILTNIFILCFDGHIQFYSSEDFVECVESLLLLLISMDDSSSSPKLESGCVATKEESGKGSYSKVQNLSSDEIASILRSVLKCAVSLCKVNKAISNQLTDIMASQLGGVKGNHRFLLCQALAGVASSDPGVLSPYMLEITSVIRDVVRKREELIIDKVDNIEDSHTEVVLCTLVMQTLGPEQLKDGYLQDLESIINVIDLWPRYRVARAAARYGHFNICANIVGVLRDKVSSEQLFFWLEGLKEMAIGEAKLLKNPDETESSCCSLLERLSQAVIHYNVAISSLKAASGPAHCHQFQCQYATLRCELLQRLSCLASACSSLCLSPPPAIAVALVHATRDEHQRSGHITNQLRKCAKELRACGDLYWKLYQSAFDADPATLHNIQILQHVCLLMAHSVESISLANYQDDEPSLNFAGADYGTNSGEENKDSNRSSAVLPLETRLMIETCRAASALSAKIDRTAKIVTHQHVRIILDQIDILISNPLCMPRYFFQVVQSTTLTLAVSPQPKVNGDWITLTAGCQLAVKVEGVIQRGGAAVQPQQSLSSPSSLIGVMQNGQANSNNPGPFRTVDKVIVSLTTQCAPRQPGNSPMIAQLPPEKLNAEASSVMTQTVKPHKDFFSAQFLVSLGPGSAQATVTVSAAVVDQSGAIWQTGPKSTLTVKQHDDPTNRTV